MVVKYGWITIAPIKIIIKNAGAKRVSEDAEEALAKVLEQFGEDIFLQAVKLAKHAKRVTVNELDIELSIKALE